MTHATTPATIAHAVDALAAHASSPADSAADDAPVLVYEQNGGSVVSITSLAAARTVFGTHQTQGVGSGFVIDHVGRIITNNHGVQLVDQLLVTFQDGTATPAVLLGRDPDNDLTVIAFDPTAFDDGGKPNC